MSHNTRTRADLTAWSSPTAEVTPEEFEQLDEACFTAINGDFGGIWAPLSTIVIGGAFGLEVSAPFLASGDSQLGDSAADACDILATLQVQNDATFDDDVTIGANSSDTLLVQAVAEFTGDTTTIGNSGADDFNCVANAHFYDEVDFEGGLVTFHDDVQFDDPVIFNDTNTFGNAAGDEQHFIGDLQVDNDANFDGLTTIAELGATGATIDELAIATTLVVTPGAAFVLNEPMTFSTKGRVPKRLGVCGDATASFGVEDADLFLWEDVVTSAVRVYTLLDDGAVNGDCMAFKPPGAGVGTELRFEKEDSTLLLELDDGSLHYVVFIREAGTWRRLLNVVG